MFHRSETGWEEEKTPTATRRFSSEHAFRDNKKLTGRVHRAAQKPASSNTSSNINERPYVSYIYQYTTCST